MTRTCSKLRMDRLGFAISPSTRSIDISMLIISHAHSKVLRSEADASLYALPDAALRLGLSVVLVGGEKTRDPQ